MKNYKAPPSDIFLNGRFDAMISGWGEPRVLAVNYETSKSLGAVGDTKGPIPLDESDKNPRIPKMFVEDDSKKLNTLMSLSIAGCDIMNSALYTAGNSAAIAGKVSSCAYFDPLH
jgi:hypothetical protein